MEVKNIIQSSARIIKITELSVGNVVKFIKESSYSKPEVKFAIVSDILNNGEKSFVEFVSFKKDYNKGVELEKETFSGKEDLALFPANKEDILTSYKEIKERASKEIADKEEELNGMKENLLWLETAIEKNKAENLTSPKFEELTTSN